MPLRCFARILPASKLGVLTVPQQGSEDRKAAQRRYLKHAGVGTQYGLTIALFAFGGAWLDGKAGMTPLFTIMGALVGFLGASVSLVHQVLGPTKKSKNKSKKKKPNE